MATIHKTPSSTWKAVIRKRGWPTTIKTFRTKRDAKDWARRTEDEMVRGVYIDRAGSDRILLKHALDRYLREVSTTKKPSTHSAEQHKAKALKAKLGAYSLAAITPDLVAGYRDARLDSGKSPSTVRLELSLLSHLFTIAIKEWRVGLFYNPVANIRKPAPTPGRDRRLTADEEKTLLQGCDQHSNPMLGWIARTVPLTREAAEVFRQALSNPVRPLDTDLIFWGEPGRDGQRRRYEFRPAWHRTLKALGIKGLRFHDLRHEAVSRLVEADLGDQEVAAISGHKSMQMLKRYTHLRAEDLVARLDQLLG